MGCLTFPLTNYDVPGKCYALVQGDTFDWLDFFIEGDYTGWEPSGSIRTNYAEAATDTPIAFTFLPLVYGTFTITPEGGSATTGLFTKVSPRLTADETALLFLPRTRKDGQRAKVGLDPNTYLYSVQLQSGAKVETIVRASYLDYVRDV
jgi:hypothetical protein